MNGACEALGDDEGDLTLVDLLLAQGSRPAQDALRKKVADEPLLALEMAETVALLEQFRQLRVEPSARLAVRLADVVRRAERRLPPPRTPLWRPLLALAAAAAVTFAALWLWVPRDDEGRRNLQANSDLFDVRRPAAPEGAATDGAERAPRIRESSEVAWESMVEVMRQRLDMEPSRRLSDALTSGLQAQRDPLGSWLDPRNALVMLRLDHELRASAELRRRAMRSQGGMEAADVRVQELADEIATELVAAIDGGTATLDEVALAVRALLAAGSAAPARAAAVEAGSDWLVSRLPHYSDANLVAALTPLVEVAAVRGTNNDLVARHGVRLVAEFLRQDGKWGRLPELLTGRIAAATLAEAGRLLRLLPGMGVDATRCGIVRQLVLGRLQERRDAGEDGPDLLVAMVYGCGDLMREAERDEVEHQLSRWKPVRLAPDFVTVQQYAWAIEPGRLGFTRLQRELRRLAVLPTPASLDDQAAFCLSLATNYAAFHNPVLLPSSAGE